MISDVKFRPGVNGDFPPRCKPSYMDRGMRILDGARKIKIERKMDGWNGIVTTNETGLHFKTINGYNDAKLESLIPRDAFNEEAYKRKARFSGEVCAMIWEEGAWHCLGHSVYLKRDTLCVNKKPTYLHGGRVEPVGLVARVSPVHGIGIHAVLARHGVAHNHRDVVLVEVLQVDDGEVEHLVARGGHVGQVEPVELRVGDQVGAAGVARALAVRADAVDADRGVAGEQEEARLGVLLGVVGLGVAVVEVGPEALDGGRGRVE
ncbi:MAG: hypothetical protein EBR81_14670, partial [Proteobacteria bacterium]|nr:hypothetical protein [Pseudomonadota bacterium]